ncbi:MAG TPA: alpha/beta fold hydrolase [Alphaproteobacteria bacterium]|nr:alpha/beta fold hydrolase [Alphaproteobacteria bacterium]
MQAEALFNSIEARSRRMETPCGDGRMVWRIWGEGAPLVLIHGGAGAWSHWIRTIPAFEGSRMVIAPDLPGLGDSASPPKPYTPESIAEIAANGLRQVLPPGAQFDMAGFSFGGMISGLMARLLRTQARSLTLMGPSGLGGQFGNIRPPVKLPLSGTPEQLAAAHRHNLAAIMLHDPAKIDDVAMHMQATNAPRTRILSPEHALSEKLLNALREIPARVCSIWGEFDISAPHLQHRREIIASVHPEAEFHIVPGAGHWVQYEAAEAVNAILRKFIA